MNQQRVLPRQFQSTYNPVQSSSYRSINQQPRLIATNTLQQQTEPISQPSIQRL